MKPKLSRIRPLRVYLAGSSREIERCWKWRDRLLEAGVEVVGSAWMTNVARNAALGITDQDLSRDDRLRAAHQQLVAIRSADVFWLLSPEVPSTGAWAELGHALGVRGCLVGVSGPTWRSCIFAELASERFSRDEDAFAWAVGAPKAPPVVRNKEFFRGSAV